MKIAIGLLLAVCVGIGCRWFGIPLPGPPAIMGAAMAVAMASGYSAADYFLTHRSVSVHQQLVPQTDDRKYAEDLPAGENRDANYGPMDVPKQ